MPSHPFSPDTDIQVIHFACLKFGASQLHGQVELGVHRKQEGPAPPVSSQSTSQRQAGISGDPFRGVLVLVLAERGNKASLSMRLESRRWGRGWSIGAPSSAQ